MELQTKNIGANMAAIFYVAYTIFSLVVIGVFSIFKSIFGCFERAIVGDYTAI